MSARPAVCARSSSRSTRTANAAAKSRGKGSSPPSIEQVIDKALEFAGVLVARLAVFHERLERLERSMGERRAAPTARKKTTPTKKKRKVPAHAARPAR
jgi:hypothetical protein